MKQFSSTLLLVVLSTSQAIPMSPLFVNEEAERDSVDLNEIGPKENWQLFTRLMKTNSYNPSDTEKTQKLLKEIEEFSRLVTPANISDGSDSITDQPDVTETDSASSDWFASTWKTLIQNDEGYVPNFKPQLESQDDGIEDTIKKITNDLKKLFVKLRQVIAVVKNWINKGKGSSNENDGPMLASASETDGVFVIADPLVGDIDKSNKYTVPIN